MERIGLMGGSFNPIHRGHLAIARQAMQLAHLDQVLFIPTGNPPHKRTGLAPAEDRYRMTETAICREKGFLPSRIELDRTGIIYSVDTLELLHAAYPGAQFFFIIGEDTLHELPTWHDPERLYTLCTFLVLRRPGVAADFDAGWEEMTRRGAHLQAIEMQPVDISSTAIRNGLATGDYSPHLPGDVAAYIALTGLYDQPPLIPQGPAWVDKLYQTLSLRRFSHTLYVVACTRELARLHHLDEKQAVQAALLHDCAKCLPLGEMQALAQAHRLTEDPAILASDNLLHSAAGAVIARETYGVTDEAILNAIACHTTGRLGMTPLEMVIFLADKIEASRAAYPLLEQIRALAQKDLASAVILSMESTVTYVQSRGETVHPATLQVLSWLKKRQV